MNWSAEQYALFERERTRPARDLLAAVPLGTARRVVDIGCGPGISTELLIARFPGATISGFDTSNAMIDAARRRLPGIQFERLDVESWDDPGPFDVLFANAVLQWLPDHDALLPALVAKLSEGGCLAIQMPDNLDEPAHRSMREIAADGRWADKLANAAQARTPLTNADWYYQILRQSCAQVDVWRTTYYHALPGVDAIVEWFRGSGLRPFLDPLDEAERMAYLDQFKSAVASAYPAQWDGTVLLPFPRLFLVAVR